MAEYNEGQKLHGSDGNIYVVRNGVPVIDSPVMGGIVTKQADPGRPYEAPKAAADLAIAQGRAAMSPSEVRKAEADARKADADARIAETTAKQGNTGKGLSPEVRKEAIGGYSSAMALQRQIDEIKRKNEAGPGSTKGLAGLLDYLGTPANAQFDDAANAARAFGGPVLGFTASQLNTEKEQQRAIGPYIPAAGDYDGQITDKINRLQGLVDLATGRSKKILGGTPDENGNIIAGNAIPGAPGGNNGGGGAPDANIPTGPSGAPVISPLNGGFTSEYDAGASARLDKMIRAGATPDQINAAFPDFDPVNPAQVSAAQQYLRANPNYKGSFADATRQKPVSAFRQAAGSAANFVGPEAATGIINAGNAVVPLALLPGASDDTNAVIKQASAANPTSALLGSLIGGVTAMAGGEALAGRALSRFAPQSADLGYGAIQGYGNADDGEGLGGAVQGGVSSLLGGEIGRRVVGGIGSALRGVTGSPRVALGGASAQQYLRGEQVPQTVGQVLGGTPKMIEDQLTGYPFIGGIIKNRRDEGLTGFNQAMFRQGAEGRPVQNIGERGAEELDQIVNQVYAPLDNVNMQADAPLVSDLQAAAQTGRAIPGRSDDFNYVVDTRVGQNFGPNGELSGRNFQDSVRGLRQAGANQGMAAMHPGDFSGALGGVEDALTGMVQRQAPDAMDTLNTGNRIYRNQSIIDEAVKSARNQRGPDGDALVMPSQLNAASVNNTNRFGGRSRAATTDRPFYELSTAGQEVLPSKVGDSGTAGRLAIAGALGLAGGGGAGLGYGGAEDGEGFTGAATGGAGGVASLAALAALGGSRGGQQALTRLLLDRPDILRRLGGSVGNNANIGGLLGAPLSLDLLGGQ